MEGLQAFPSGSISDRVSQELFNMSLYFDEGFSQTGRTLASMMWFHEVERLKRFCTLCNNCFFRPSLLHSTAFSLLWFSCVCLFRKNQVCSQSKMHHCVYFHPHKNKSNLQKLEPAEKINSKTCFESRQAQNLYRCLQMQLCL